MKKIHLLIAVDQQLLTEKMNIDKNDDALSFHLNVLIHLLTVSIDFFSMCQFDVVVSFSLNSTLSIPNLEKKMKRIQNH